MAKAGGSAWRMPYLQLTARRGGISKSGSAAISYKAANNLFGG